ncbi:hypothetical protein JJV70_15285 [Streptomyces sp. JJ66]|uniref:hypothetical protein n=1 Tax=Streptomyces sp. JJ66 TaxID=2803843 RepID=UPI001C565E82|nr:hypothetical protein [Streptomyces sp. JJ66]MBW1603443.1 hypothetical protein [Streptomyces sp. JJ66]
MANLAELALREAALKTLADAVGEQLRAVKAAMQQELEITGASRVDATLPDGTKVATISRTSPKATAVVTDEDAFLAWVRQAAPSEVVSRVVTEVRPAYRASLLAQMTAAGVAEVADAATGELSGVPGVEVRAGRATTHSVRHAKGGGEAIITAWRDCKLTHLDLPQLVSGHEQGSEAA